MSNMKTDSELELPQRNPDLIKYLTRRRSNLVKNMVGPGPNKDELTQILTIGTRVPDHRKLAPWRFLVFQGPARAKIGIYLKRVFSANNPKAAPGLRKFEEERFLQAPLVIGVISSPIKDRRATPKWEQRLSAGAVCFNLCLAAQSLGYGAQWLTQWYAYDPALRPVWGLGVEEKIAGFIYIGKTNTLPLKRTRPNLEEIVQLWQGPVVQS